MSLRLLSLTSNSDLQLVLFMDLKSRKTSDSLAYTQQLRVRTCCIKAHFWHLLCVCGDQCTYRSSTSILLRQKHIYFCRVLHKISLQHYDLLLLSTSIEHGAIECLTSVHVFNSKAKMFSAFFSNFVVQLSNKNQMHCNK